MEGVMFKWMALDIVESKVGVTKALVVVGMVLTSHYKEDHSHRIWTMIKATMTNPNLSPPLLIRIKMKVKNRKIGFIIRS